MKTKRVFPSLIIACACLLGGCVSSSEIKATQTSVGQQLLDLEQAREKGVISQKEYLRLKKAIIKKND